MRVSQHTVNISHLIMLYLFAQQYICIYYSLHIGNPCSIKCSIILCLVFTLGANAQTCTSGTRGKIMQDENRAPDLLYCFFFWSGCIAIITVPQFSYSVRMVFTRHSYQ